MFWAGGALSLVWGYGDNGSACVAIAGFQEYIAARSSVYRHCPWSPAMFFVPLLKKRVEDISPKSLAHEP